MMKRIGEGILVVVTRIMSEGEIGLIQYDGSILKIME
jgi:hypothetical protein